MSKKKKTNQPPTVPNLKSEVEPLDVNECEPWGKGIGGMV